MAELEQAIKNLDRNLRLLIKKNKRLEQELIKLKGEKKKLEEQNSILKSSQQKLDPEEKKAAEKQIQQFIQEIDRCISFLSR